MGVQSLRQLMLFFTSADQRDQRYGQRSLSSRDGSLHSVPCQAKWHREPVPAPWHCDDAGGRRWSCRKRLAQRQNLCAQIAFFDNKIGPDPSNQLVFADNASGVFDQHPQYLKRSRTQRHRFIAAKQQLLFHEQSEWRKGDDRLVHRQALIDHIFNLCPMGERVADELPLRAAPSQNKIEGERLQSMQYALRCELRVANHILNTSGNMSGLQLMNANAH